MTYVHSRHIIRCTQCQCIWWCATNACINRARRSEARIQQMLWKINYSDIVFVNTVCSDVVLVHLDDRLKYYNTSITLFSDAVF